MTNEIRWKHHNARDLLLDVRNPIGEAIPLEGIIPTTPAIYIWKLRPYTLGMEQMLPWRSFLDHIDDRLTAPMTEKYSMDKRMLFISEVELKGQKITDEKREQLEEMQNTVGKQRYFKDFLKTLAPHSPSLYVGETENLRARTIQHLKSQSDFGRKIEEHKELTFEDLDFYYLAFGAEFESNFSEEKDRLLVRQTLEWIATMISLAGFTSRPG